MSTTLDPNEDLLDKAKQFGNLRGNAALVRQTLRAMTERESARRLARLGGTEPDLEAGPRRAS
jgi:hypothetical protein